MLHISISKELMNKISCIVRSKTGLYFPESRWDDLEKGLKRTITELNYRDGDTFIDRLLSYSLSDMEKDILIDNLTIGETFFFRDKDLFHVLKNKIFPWKINHHNSKSHVMSIWSAGCCSGEEPYSIAILLDQMTKGANNCNAEIFAADINNNFLNKARTGIYTRWSLRNTPEDIVKEYFIKKDKNEFELSCDIRKAVTFSQLNLRSAIWPGPFNRTLAFDLILFRNVLMYFDPDTISKTIDRLYKALTNGGWLAVSPSESAFVKHKGLAAAYFSGVVLYRKKEAMEKNELPCLTISTPAQVKRAPDNTKLFKHFTSMEKTDNRMGKTGSARGHYKKLNHALDLYREHNYKECEKYLIHNFSSSIKEKTSKILIPKVINLLSRVKANLDKPVEALDFCRKAIAMDKLNPDHRYLLSVIYNSLNDTENEKKALDQTIYLDPNHVLAHIQLGNLAKKQLLPNLSQKHMNLAKQILDSMDPEDIISGSDGLVARELLNLTQMN